jgi:hypothetical protein
MPELFSPAIGCLSKAEYACVLRRGCGTEAMAVSFANSETAGAALRLPIFSQTRDENLPLEVNRLSGPAEHQGARRAGMSLAGPNSNHGGFHHGR